MADAVAKTAPQKAGSKNWLLLLLVALIAGGAGAFFPQVLLHSTEKRADVPAKDTKKTALLPFDTVVVNLGEERLTRYLRVKIILVVDHKEEKNIVDVLQNQKAFLKSWLISYLSDQSIQEVGRAAGVNRIRREVRDQFNAMLFSDGSEKIHDILFDEFQVQ
jgi:flagellar protein FliL